MNTETIPDPTLPEWLCASDLWKSIHTCSDPETAEGEHRIIPLELRDLPVCELDCGDPILLYKVMGAWCLPWSEVPLILFFPLWMGLNKKVRVSLLKQYLYYEEELDTNDWYQNMCTSDDDLLVAALLNNNNKLLNMITMIEFGSVKCLQKVAKHFNWDKTNWGNIYGYLINRYPKGKVINSLALITLLHKKGVLDSRIGAWAATEGHLDCLQYIFESGIPLYGAICRLAIEHGNLSCLRYAIEHRLIFSVFTKGAWVTCQLNDATGRIEVIPDYNGNKYDTNIRTHMHCWQYFKSLKIYDVRQIPIQILQFE